MNDINALTPDERTVLETMACLYYPVDRVDMEGALHRLGLCQRNGKPFTIKALAGLLAADLLDGAEGTGRLSVDELLALIRSSA